MAVVSKEELFSMVKGALGVTSDLQDQQIKPFFDDVICFLLEAGAKEENILQDTTAGLLSRGVSDLWDTGTGNTRLSEYFIQRAIQFTKK